MGGWELFRRMAKINQDVTNVYLLGIVAALGACLQHLWPLFLVRSTDNFVSYQLLA